MLLQHLVVFAQFFRRPGIGNLTLGYDVAEAHQFQGQLGVLLDNQDTDAGTVDLLESGGNAPVDKKPLF